MVFQDMEHLTWFCFLWPQPSNSPEHHDSNLWDLYPNQASILTIYNFMRPLFDVTYVVNESSTMYSGFLPQPTETHRFLLFFEV